MRDFFRQQWHNVISLIFSFLALGVAIQANLIAQNNSIALIDVQPVRDNPTGDITISGCFAAGDANSPPRYYVYFIKSQELIFSNSGGRPASLRRYSFNEGGEAFEDTGMRAFNFDTKKYEAVPPSLNVGAGGAETRLVVASNSTSWESEIRARESITEMVSPNSPKPEKPLQWEFEFTNMNEKVVFPYVEGEYIVDPGIESPQWKSCTE